MLISSCDLHSPDAFRHIETPVVKVARQPPRSSIGKYVANDVDNALRLHLETWRADEMKRQYGQAWLRCMGPGLVMGTTVRDRIVDCAHFNKIRSVVDLKRETKWDLASTYGEAILDIIYSHYPPTVPLPLVIDLVNTTSDSSQPIHNMPQAGPSGVSMVISTNPSSSRRRSEARCSLCQQTGHNCKQPSFSLSFYLTLMSYQREIASVLLTSGKKISYRQLVLLLFPRHQLPLPLLLLLLLKLSLLLLSLLLLSTSLHLLLTRHLRQIK